MISDVLSLRPVRVTLFLTKILLMCSLFLDADAKCWAPAEGIASSRLSHCEIRPRFSRDVNDNGS